MKMIQYDRNRKDMEIPVLLGNAPGEYDSGYLGGETYDLILFNLATKATYTYTGLTDAGNILHYTFEEFEPGDIPYGEYSYALIYNGLEGCSYEPKNALLDTVISYGGQEYRLGDLSPETGLLKYIPEDGEEETSAPAYRDTDVEYYYRRR